MKILIIANNQKWKSWDSKIQELKDWFAPAVSMEITLEHSNFTKVPLEDYINSKGEKSKGIGKVWYDQNISIPSKAKGYDIVIFSVGPEIWKGHPSNGWHTGNSHGIYEIQMTCLEKQTYTYKKRLFPGSRWFNLARHELCHALYDIQGKVDRTHYHWELGDPANALLELKNEVAKPMETYKYFKPSEIKGLRHELVSLLDKCREEAGIPFVINSGFRTKEENDKLPNAVSDSSHLDGIAVDIKCLDSSSRWKIVNAAIKVGFKRIGIGNNFVHLDVDILKSDHVIWTYYY